jgi:hypothetical protein
MEMEMEMEMGDSLLLVRASLLDTVRMLLGYAKDAPRIGIGLALHTSCIISR